MREPTTTFHSFGSGCSLPSRVPHRDKIVRASRGVSSPSLSRSTRLLLSLLSLLRIVLLPPLLFNVYPLSSYLGALLIGLSSVLTMILARERRYHRTTRSSYRRAMRPGALLARKPNWPAFKKGYKPSHFLSLTPPSSFPYLPLPPSLPPPLSLSLSLSFIFFNSSLSRRSETSVFDKISFVRIRLHVRTVERGVLCAKKTIVCSRVTLSPVLPLWRYENPDKRIIFHRKGCRTYLSFSPRVSPRLARLVRPSYLTVISSLSTPLSLFSPLRFYKSANSTDSSETRFAVPEKRFTSRAW